LIVSLIQARQYLEEYNMLNNYAAKHFKTLARDSSKLDGTLKDLTRKLSKLTHKSAPPGTANTQNASTVQNPGVHEIYVQRLTGLSGQIQQVRKDHLGVYTKVQKDVDRYTSRAFARCSRQNYGFLADALVKTGSAEAMGGVNAWGVFANAGISPPIHELDGDGDTEAGIDDDWEASYEEADEAQLSPRQVASSQNPRPPSSLADHLTPPPDPRNTRYPTMSLNMQGKLPASTSQTSFNPYPGNSSQPFQPSQGFQPAVRPFL
jgi:hypothetical protein